MGRWPLVAPKGRSRFAAARRKLSIDAGPQARNRVAGRPGGGGARPLRVAAKPGWLRISRNPWPARAARKAFEDTTHAGIAEAQRDDRPAERQVRHYRELPRP